MKFSERLKHLRIDNRMTQAELAARLSITQQTVSQYESGEIEPKFDTIKNLVEIFNLPAGFIMGISDDREQIEMPDDVITLIDIYNSGPKEIKELMLNILKVIKESEKELVKYEK